MAFSVRNTSIAVAIVLAFLYATHTFLGWRWALVSAAAWVLFGLWVSNDELLDENASLAAMHKRGLNTQRYNKNEVPENLDAIVIGSGMGGMSCAALLARLGRKVLVLEQHEMTGGGTHMYELGPSGKYKFDSGLHYVVPYSGLLLHILTGGPRPLIRFPKVGDSTGTFDEVVFVTGKDQTEKFAIKHHEAHLPELYKQFPKEKAEIDRFLKVSESVMLKFPIWLLSKLCPMWLQKIISNTILSKFIHYCGRGTMDVLNEITDNNRLKSLLCSLWIDTGCPPDIATFMLSACVIRGLPHEGGAYPAGGSDLMSRSLIPVIERAGGRVLCRASVEQVITGPNGATGVRLANGDEISAPLVVSAIGFPNTQKIIDESTKSRFNVPASIPVKSSLGFVMANIGLKGSAADLGLTCKNLWVHPVPDCKTDKGCDLMAGWHSFCKNGSMANPPSPAELPAWITFPSMKDRDWALTHPDSTTCQILVMTPYEWWDREDWKHGKSGSRGAEYEQIKQKWKDQCVSLLLRFYPHFKEKIELVDLSTPLTIEHYLREPKGGAIGLDVSPNRFADPEVIAALDMKTKVPGLWMTGQDTLLCGQPMVQIAGVLTALRIVGITGGVKFAAYGLRSLAQWLLTTPPPSPVKKTV